MFLIRRVMSIGFLDATLVICTAFGSHLWIQARSLQRGDYADLMGPLISKLHVAKTHATDRAKRAAVEAVRFRLHNLPQNKTGHL
jgi:hypothetical protein